MQGLLPSFFVAFLVSAGLTLLVLRAALRKKVLIDSPNERSSHEQPKPRGGGLGVVGGLIAGFVIASHGFSLHPASSRLLLGTLACALIGLWDDIRGLSVGPRLIAQFAVSAWMVFESGPLLQLPLPAPLDVPLGFLGFVFPLVWLVGVMNFFNFMDGIDGLAAGQAIAVCLCVAACAWDEGASALALVTAGALFGFLPFNWWPSRIFLGDIGSLSVGFLLAALPLLAPAPERPRAVLSTAVALTLFLLDPVLTLWRRFRRGAPLGQAHREHLYQQFLGPKDPHRVVTSALIGAALVLALAAWVAYRRPELGWIAVFVAGLAFATEYGLALRRPGR